MLSLCKASPPILAFDDESPSQTGWRTGLSVLDLVHPTHLKSRECFSPVIPEPGDAHCLSVCCLQQASEISSRSREATALSQKDLQGKMKGSRRGRGKGNERDMHTSSN